VNFIATDNSSLNFADLHPSYAANSAPPLLCAELFIVPQPATSTPMR